MFSFLRMSDASAIALHTVRVLALAPSSSVTNQDVASLLGVSVHHLAKVHQRLVHAGLLVGVRGPAGGFRLARDPSTITLMEVVEAVEGTFEPHQCLLGRPKCATSPCALGQMSDAVNSLVRGFLVNTTVDRLASDDSLAIDGPTGASSHEKDQHDVLLSV
ncbi:MAG: Rrf2 family transcriptional regulator [Capsulimonadaceae bacterium]|nr:Rrf2 family transcriptional regulator [Capsulimonadaceae bacterium]